MGSGNVVQSKAENFEGDVRSPARARAFVRDAMAEWGFVSDDVVLVVSELVSNVISHAANCPFCLSLEFDGRLVHVSVSDPGDGWPTINPVRARSGRGLRIVDELAADWGVKPSGGGKTVWVDMPLPLGL
jgi:anti-sigma regulatory factor (Ser/Thr protein kinase)